MKKIKKQFQFRYYSVFDLVVSAAIDKIDFKYFNVTIDELYISMFCIKKKPAQLIFTCSKSTIETLEKGVKICSKLAIKISERRH